MWSIRHLKNHNMCPHCNSTRISSVSINGVHTNGSQFETVSFDCGHTVKFIPNFMREEVTSDCRHSDKHKKREENINRIVNAIKAEAEKCGFSKKINLSDLTFAIRLHVMPHITNET